MIVCAYCRSVFASMGPCSEGGVWQYFYGTFNESI